MGALYNVFHTSHDSLNASFTIRRCP